MVPFLVVISFIAALLGAAILVFSKTSVHEVASIGFFMIAAITFSGAGIVEAVNRHSKKVCALIKQPASGAE